MSALLPVYYQIKHTIKKWIVNKEFSQGDKIPSENELAEKFKVSRLTVRQAISELIQEGFLRSKRGEGTFVTYDGRLINSLILESTGFMDDLFYQVSGVKTQSVWISRIPASKLISQKLQLIEGEEVVLIKRVRLLRNEIFAYTINYLPMEIGAKIREESLYQKPLLKTLEQDFKIKFIEAFQTIEASFADTEVAEKLKIPSGSPILYIERIMYSRGKKPVEFVQSSHRGETYKYVLRLKNTRREGNDKWTTYV